MVVRTGPTTDRVHIALWAGAPEQSDGLAVSTVDGAPTAIYPIPLCGCGERACGNAGLQLANDVAAEALPTLVDLLRRLPTTSERPKPGSAWTGSPIPPSPET
jgi:hypothetical protein